jgi:hypothetical protein
MAATRAGPDASVKNCSDTADAETPGMFQGADRKEGIAKIIVCLVHPSMDVIGEIVSKPDARN